MNNRIVLAASVAMLAPMGGTVMAKSQPQPQNVLFILVDDLGWNDLGFMGSEYYETPNLDRLAKSGVVFSDAYAACQVSSPSRASIMSGLYPTNHGVTDWIGARVEEDWRKTNRHSKLLPAAYNPHIEPDYTLMPELLKENGYATFFAGKWHLGDEETDWPEYQGFDINKGGWDSGGPRGGYFAPYINPRLDPGPDGENLTMRLARETAQFLVDHTSSRKGRNKPFFAYLSFYAVHGPIETTEEYWSYFRDKAEKMGLVEEGKGFAVDRTIAQRQQQDNPVYAGLIKTMDDAVGVVLDKLEALGLDDNTLVVFTSDNGGVIAGDASSTSLKPLRGGKGYQFEGGIRVPLVIRDPAGRLNGTECSTPVHGIDYYPTIMSHLGVDIPSDVKLDGVDVTPLLRGEKIADRPLFWHYPHYGNQGGEPSSIIRKGDWKLVYYHEDSRCELYNLKEDLSEMHHINIQHPDKVEELRSELMAWLDETNAVMPTADMTYDPVKEAEVLTRYKTTGLDNLEKTRMQLLSPDFEPTPDWWSSQVTID